MVLTLGVYYIISYTYIILLYIIHIHTISYTILFRSFLPSSSLPLHLSSLPIFPSYIHSILVGTYIYLFIFFLSLIPIFPIFKNNLTPHKLSEGCLEWCSFISIGLCCLAFDVLTPHVLSEWMVEV
jgi:hypothetical protein